MPGLLKITKTSGKVVVLHLEGNLDASTEGLAVAAAREEFDSGVRSLLLDFGGLTMISSAGLRAIHTIYKMYTPAGEIQAWGREHPEKPFKSPYLKIAGPSSDIHYTLSISGLLHNIYIFPTLQEALDSFSS
jgi:hypothetical protein